jgi:hypothetical protein
MSASRRIHVARYPLTDGRRIDVDVWYPTLRDIARRYFLSVQPVTVRPDGITVYTPTEGYRVGLDEAPRFNARKLEALAADPAVLDMARLVVERVREDEATREAIRTGALGRVLPADDPRPF